MSTIDALREGEAFEDERFERLDLEALDFADKEFHRCTFVNTKRGLPG